MYIKRRIAAATLALALALGGIVGVGVQSLEGPDNEATEQAGSTWSLTIPGSKGWSHTNGSTWS